MTGLDLCRMDFSSSSCFAVFRLINKFVFVTVRMECKCRMDFSSSSCFAVFRLINKFVFVTVRMECNSLFITHDKLGTSLICMQQELT